MILPAVRVPLFVNIFQFLSFSGVYYLSFVSVNEFFDYNFFKIVLKENALQQEK